MLRPTHRCRLASLLFVACFGTAASTFAQQATIEAPGSPGSSSTGWDVTNEGVVAGEAYIPAGSGTERTAYRWNQAGVGADLSSNVAVDAIALGISDDGSVICGALDRNNEDTVQGEHLRWTASGGTQYLPPVPSGWTMHWAEGISGDGNYLVGSAGYDLGNSQGFRHATRWSLENGLEDLDERSTSGSFSYALAASFDGSVVVGESNVSGRSQAFRWTAFTGMQVLDAVGDVNSGAYGVSADGGVIVGKSLEQNGWEHAFRWTSLTGMQDLHPSGVTNAASGAFDVSADGRVIVGFCGSAAVWIDGQFQTLTERLTALGVNLTGWSSLDVAYGCSPDGRFITGCGTFEGFQRAFRVRLRTGNAAPTLTTPEAVSIECNGGINSVTLSTVVSDADLLDRLNVVWRVDGIVSKSEFGLISGSTSEFQFNYSDGPHIVTVEASDGISTTAKETTVTVIDTTAPVIVVAPTLTLPVDRQEIFASSSRIPQPTVRDACDDAPAVFLDAPARLPIGTTTVTWTVKDLSGNVATATQRVTVVNQAPTANAGRTVSKTTKSKSAKATLDGSKSKDPDGQTLKFQWKAKGIRFVNAGVAKPTATFPLGRTVVTLTVTDPAGRKSTDTTTVVVSRARRSNAVAADAYARASTGQAAVAVARGADSDAASGLRLAAYAEAIGAFAGDEILDSEISYLEQAEYAGLRHRQSEISAAAVEAFARSYASSGDEAALNAAIYSFSSSSYARQDLDR